MLRDLNVTLNSSFCAAPCVHSAASFSWGGQGTYGKTLTCEAKSGRCGWLSVLTILWSNVPQRVHFCVWRSPSAYMTCVYALTPLVVVVNLPPSGDYNTSVTVYNGNCPTIAIIHVWVSASGALRASPCVLPLA